jgi:hypothetical protein
MAPYLEYFSQQGTINQVDCICFHPHPPMKTHLSHCDLLFAISDSPVSWQDKIASREIVVLIALLLSFVIASQQVIFNHLKIKTPKFPGLPGSSIICTSFFFSICYGSKSSH